MGAVILFVSSFFGVIQFLLCRVKHILFLYSFLFNRKDRRAHFALTRRCSSLTYSALTYFALNTGSVYQNYAGLDTCTFCIVRALDFEPLPEIQYQLSKIRLGCIVGVFP